MTQAADSRLRRPCVGSELGCLGSRMYFVLQLLHKPSCPTWVAPMSLGRKDLGVGVLGGMLYAVGGFNIDSPKSYLASVEVFQPANNSWIELSE